MVRALIKKKIAALRMWLIPLTQVRLYVACAVGRRRDPRLRFGVGQSFLAALARIVSFDDVPVTHGLMMGGKSEQGFKREHADGSADCSEHEFIEIAVDVLAAQTVICAEAPSLHQRESPVNPRQDNVSAILPTMRGSCR